MIRHLISSAAALVLTVSPVWAQLTRTDRSAPQNFQPAAAEGVPLPKGFDKFVRPAVSHEPAAIGHTLPVLSTKSKTPSKASGRTVLRAPMAKATVKATSLSGYLSYSESTYQSQGWYNVTWPTPTLVWANPSSSNRSYTCGFMRGGELYAFYTHRTTTALLAAGICRLDPANGTVLENTPFDIFEGYSCIVTDAAYDPVNDIAYVVTSNDAGTQYILQTYNPTTGVFTPAGINFGDENSSDLPMTMAWSPADNAAYILTFGKEMKRYDATGKKFVKTGTSTYDFGDYSGIMTYSPKDNAFVGLLPGYDNSDDDWDYGYEAPAKSAKSSATGECCDVLLITPTGTTSYVGTFTYDSQWSILHASDPYVVPGAPGTVTLTSNFVDDATSGTITVNLPAKTADGSAINGRVYLQVKVDGEALGGTTPSGTPGSTATISLNLSEGEHTIAVTPYLLGDDGYIYGTPALLHGYFGYDTPAAPANVTLTNNKVTWNAVTAGVHNGYIKAADVRYNVFVDGVAMNSAPVSGTSLDITLPSAGGISHKAEVVATVNGKSSEPGSSAPLYVTGPLNLPVYIAPEEGETELAQTVIDMFTIVKNPAVTSTAQHWQYDLQDPHTGGFYCLNPTTPEGSGNCNEWLFLPAINFNDANSFYRLQMEVWAANHYFSEDETYEVALCAAPDGKNPVVIKEAETIHKAVDFQTAETMFKVPSAGVWYIGIHYITPVDAGFRLYARRFRVEKEQSTGEAPGKVTDLTAEACPQGELAANVSFRMPLVSITGADLGAATDITATVATESGSVTVSGKPGTQLTAKVPANQGNNTVKVTTSTAAGTGLIAETTVYCGVYAPGDVTLTSSVSDDNRTVTLNWTLDDYNADGQYAGADKCTFTIYRRTAEGEWGIAAAGVQGNTWSFTTTRTDQDIYQFGVAAVNAAGSSETLSATGVILGTPYNIPFSETFPLNGENIEMKEPIMLESLSYLGGLWGFSNPTDIDDNASNESGIALVCQGVTLSQMTLPKFSTTGSHNVKFELSMYFSSRTPSFVEVYASSAATPMQLVATFTADNGDGWENKIIDLPAEFQDKPWISITIRLNIENYSQCFMMDGYKLSDYPAEMMSIDSFDTLARFTVGRQADIKGIVRNHGTSQAAAPASTLEITTPAGTETFNSQPDATLAPGATAAYDFKYTPKNAAIGDGTVKFSIAGQPASAVSTVSKSIKVLNAPLPEVSDLGASVNKLSETNGDVTLTWSEAQYVQGFEHVQPWSISEDLDGFMNIDRDGNNTYAITELNYPDKYQPKAFQVFNATVSDSPVFAAHGGEQYIVGIASAKNSVTDDWLISPEVKAGSKVSLCYNLLSTQYPAVLKVMWSDGSTNPLDFQEVENGVIEMTETGWQKVTVTLPAAAKRFALWHDGHAGDELFGFMIDDIVWEPLVPEVPFTGYNLYRDGQLIAQGLTTPGYLDSNVDLSAPVQYVVRTVGTVAGEQAESPRSNIVWVDLNTGAIDGVDGDALRSVSAGRGIITLDGFDAGLTVRVLNAAGQTVIVTGTAGSHTTIACAPGLYIVECAGLRAKVAVR